MAPKFRGWCAWFCAYVMFSNLLSCSLALQVRFLGVSDGNMSEGSLRCDVNVSVRRKGDTQLGTKVRTVAAVVSRVALDTRGSVSRWRSKT